MPISNPFMRPELEIHTDVLVLGSGAGGLSAAVTAAHLGLSVIVAEKAARLGGTTAWSGGWMWIPRNPLAREAGIHEDPEAARQYLQHELGERFDPKRSQAYLDHGPAMVEFFRRHTALQFIDGNAIPDFHGHVPHAGLGGRSVCAAPFDGRSLGKQSARIEAPLPPNTLWGMGIASGADLKHFIHALSSPKSFWHVCRRLGRHVLDLLIHGHSTQFVNGQALVGALVKSALDQGVALWTEHRGTELLWQNQRVVGARLQSPEGERTVWARRGVVLACGGFPRDQARKRELLPHDPTGQSHWSAGFTHNTGDGLRLGESVGGQVDASLHQAAALAPVSLVPRANGGVHHFPHLIDRAKPGLIAVTAQGQRFTNEANAYHDVMQDLLRATPKGPHEAWLLVDHRFIRRYGLGAVKPFPFPLKPWLANGYLRRGRTWEELALACGIHAQALRETIARYNAAALQGHDPDFGKGLTPYNRIQGDAVWAAQHGWPNPCMGTLEQGPFYAVKVVMGSLGTFAGLKVNDQAQVLNASGHAIEGLYASGNDQSSLMGGHYPAGGITLGPAMTFGHIAAHHLAGQDLPLARSSSSSCPLEKRMHYELATLTLGFGTAAKAAEAVAQFCQTPEHQGELLGVWFSDIGALNQMWVLRGFDGLSQLRAEQSRTRQSANPFGCAEWFSALSQTGYEGFAWMPPVRPSAETGIHGPVYEIRTYGIKPGGLQATIDLWEQAVPERAKRSPCVVAMVALDGPLRFTNIWAYASLNDRTAIRAQAVSDGIWPPKGGPAHLSTDMFSTIALPLASSPLK
ncbi:MAG: hypothetical protein RL307_91 [Pseudomonadota bacterium]